MIRSAQATHPVLLRLGGYGGLDVYFGLSPSLNEDMRPI
jgi:hypothetical protein